MICEACGELGAVRFASRTRPGGTGGRTRLHVKCWLTARGYGRARTDTPLQTLKILRSLERQGWLERRSHVDFERITRAPW